MTAEEKTLSINKARAQQLKLFADISTPDCSAPYFNIIGGRRTNSATCILCHLVMKGHYGAERRRFRLRHLDLKHPEIMETIEKEKLKELAKKKTIVQENSTIPFQKSRNIGGIISKKKVSLVSLQYPRLLKRRKLQEADSYGTIFKYFQDIDKSECEICGFIIHGNSAMKLYGHFNNVHNEVKAPLKVEDSSSGMSDLEEGNKRAIQSSSELSFMKRRLIEEDDFLTTFRYICDIDKSQCEICGFFIQGKSSRNQLKHFDNEHKNKFLLPATSTLFYEDEVKSSLEMSDNKPEQGDTSASFTFNLPVSYPPHKDQQFYGNCKINYKLEPQTNVEVLDKSIEMTSVSDSEKIVTNPIKDISIRKSPLPSLRPLLPTDEPNSTFTFINRQDKSQCQICGKLVIGTGIINRRMHFNNNHKQQRNQLQRLNGIIIAQTEFKKRELNRTQDILPVKNGTNEWKELRIFPNNFKAEDSDSEVDSDEEEEDIFNIRSRHSYSTRKKV